jgi:hypothetical protein
VSGRHIGPPCDLPAAVAAMRHHLHGRGFFTIGEETLRALESLGFDPARIRGLPPYEAGPAAWWGAVHAECPA